jgi:hypothetical protein
MCYVVKGVTACLCRPVANDSLDSAAHRCSSLEHHNELLPCRITTYICNTVNLCFSRLQRYRAKNSHLLFNSRVPGTLKV